MVNRPASSRRSTAATAPSATRTRSCCRPWPARPPAPSRTPCSTRRSSGSSRGSCRPRSPPSSPATRPPPATPAASPPSPSAWPAPSSRPRRRPGAASASRRPRSSSFATPPCSTTSARWACASTSSPRPTSSTPTSSSCCRRRFELARAGLENDRLRARLAGRGEAEVDGAARRARRLSGAWCWWPTARRCWPRPPRRASPSWPAGPSPTARGAAHALVTGDELQLLSIPRGSLSDERAARDREPRHPHLPLPLADPLDPRAPPRPRDRLRPPREARRPRLPARHGRRRPSPWRRG